MVSAPVPPSSVLLPLLPVIVLASSLPVPLMLPAPVSVRFSTLPPEHVTDGRLHRVGAFVEGLRHHVAGVVDESRCHCRAPPTSVSAPSAAVERVVAAVACERVAEAAADHVLDAGDRREAVCRGSDGAEIDGHAERGGAGIAERVAVRALSEAVDRVDLHVVRRHALDRGDDARDVEDDVDDVVASGSRHRQRVTVGGVGAAVDDVDAVADGVEEGVVASAGIDGVVAASAADDVGDVVAEDGVVAGAAVDVLDVDQHVGADVDALRVANLQIRIVRRLGGFQEVADRAAAVCRLLRAVVEPEINRDAVGGRRIADGVVAAAAVIDVIAAALSADDLVVAAASLDDVVAASGVDRVGAGTGDDEVVAGTGGDMRGAGAGDLDRGVHMYGMVKSRSSSVLSSMSSGAVGAVANRIVSPGCVKAPASIAACRSTKPPWATSGSMSTKRPPACWMNSMPDSVSLPPALPPVTVQVPAGALKTTSASASVVVYTAVSAPVPPSSRLLPLLPVMTLASSLPVPAMLPLPVRVRFSTLAPSV